MKITAVASTTLRPVAYDPVHSSSTIGPCINLPRTRPYSEGLLKAPSKGIYFNRSIRQKFDYAKIKAPSLS
jgi:hypothetical protein